MRGRAHDRADQVQICQRLPKRSHTSSIEEVREEMAQLGRLHS